MHLVPLEEYCRRLKSDPQRGLSSAEAKLRLGREGPNLLVQRRRVPELLKFLRQLTNLFAILLWSGAGLCLLAEFLTPGQGNMAIAAVLVGVVLLNGSFSYWQGRRAEEIMASSVTCSHDLPGLCGMALCTRFRRQSWSGGT
jgi:sodium/potassium-transporting ATPase subunit alpha